MILWVPTVRMACSMGFRGLAAAGITHELSLAMLEGFVGAKVLVEALRRAGPAPTRLKLQTALENLKNCDVGGLKIGYSVNNHTGLDFADMSVIGADGKFKR